MADPPDYAALLAGHAEALDLIDAGVGASVALTRLLSTAQAALGAAGLSLVEPGAVGGRIVLATGAMTSAVGQPVDLDRLACDDAPRSAEVEVIDLSGWLADHLARHDLPRVLIARTGVRQGGHLLAHFRPDARLTSDHHGVMAFLASAVGHLAWGVGSGGAGGLADTQDRHTQDPDLFVALIGHELRTPVTVIKGYAETLATHWESLADADRRQAAEAIGQRSTELARLVDRLLAAATPDPVDAAPFDVAGALRGAVAELPSRLRRRLSVELPDELPKALGDPVSVAWVLSELVTNADKYSPAGSPVELTAAADEAAVLFRVEDRGVGIRPEHVERAFDRFWRGEQNDDGRYPGIGLGLYLARKLIQRQNGRISVRPREMGGTVVEVRLPRG
ncbi:MAG TPA: HAMP domain-containing sensor histidine kinase [Micromonosporaceae bacterium]